MTLQASGQITYENLNVELGNSSSAQASMDSMTSSVPSACNSTIANEPDSIEDWYSYNHLGLPGVVQNVSCTYTVKIDHLGFSWDDLGNEASYYLAYEIYNYGCPCWGSFTYHSSPGQNVTSAGPIAHDADKNYRAVIRGVNCHGNGSYGYSGGCCTGTC